MWDIRKQILHASKALNIEVEPKLNKLKKKYYHFGYQRRFQNGEIK
ncbi:hypothetical protein [Oceanirhabdus sp. W0125-5]|nr:hypothetical protein [Oceanirhabdus sp. W0125-5]WBW96085.1 hypothetical protein OW730_20675 [Oceanirhabdus sp. W0125-5]